MALLLVLGISPFGTVMILLWFWASNERRRDAMLQVYRDDLHRVLQEYGSDVAKLSRFYETNVELLKSWKAIAEGFQQTVVLNTSTMQRMCDMMQTNQYCPNARLPK